MPEVELRRVQRAAENMARDLNQMTHGQLDTWDSEVGRGGMLWPGPRPVIVARLRNGDRIRISLDDLARIALETP